MIVIVLLFFIVCCNARENTKPQVEQVHVGNFALPASQQPGPLVGFGQNIIDKGDIQLFVYPDQLKGKQKNFIEVAPSLLYAFSDTCSLFIEQSVAAKFKVGPFTSHGLEDLLIQLEGLLYSHETIDKVNALTLVANITLPTGSAFKVPPTGFGAPSFFIGFTASHTQLDWYLFTAYAGIITTQHKNSKFGNQFLYQYGLSKNICYKADKWLFNWMVELDGIYRQRNKFRGVIDADSGGNIVLLGPSLWFSTQHLILQLGISAVVSEHLFGLQTKDSYFLAADVGWKF
jgi:hypothetical protein